MSFNLDEHYGLSGDPNTAGPTMDAFLEDIETASNTPFTPDPTSQTASNQPPDSASAPRTFSKPGGGGIMMANHGTEEHKLDVQRGVDWELPPQGETAYVSKDKDGNLRFYFYPHGEEVGAYFVGNVETGEPWCRAYESSVDELRSKLKEARDAVQEDDPERKVKRAVIQRFLDKYKTEADFRSIPLRRPFSENRV